MPSQPKTKDRIFYGWVVVTAALIISIILLGTRHSYGVFFKSIEGEFDLSRAMTSGIFSAFMALGAVFSILGGWALDKYGPRTTFSLMGLFACISLLLTSRTTSAWQLYISYSLLLAMGSGETYTVVMALVSRWFYKKRGLALGISGTGGGLGTIVITPFATYLILNFDWRMAYMVMGVVAGLVIISVATLLKRQPSELGLLPYGANSNPGEVDTFKEDKTQPSGFSLREAIITRQFWFLFIIGGFQSLSIYFILTHMIPHATDVGISATEAAKVLSVIGGFSMLGGLGAGSASDVISRKTMSIICSLFGTGALCLLMWSQALWSFYVFAVFFGIQWGGLATMISAITGDIFGTRNIGSILGWTGSSWFIGAAIGPAMGGLIFDATRSYFGAFLISAVAMLVITLFVALLTRPQRKI